MKPLRFLFLLIIILFSSAEISAQEDVFICGGVNDQRTIMDPGQLRGITYTLKILLVEFSDIHHKPNITYTNWNNLFFRNIRFTKYVFT